MISLSNRRTFFFALTYDYNEQEKMRVAEIAELVNLDPAMIATEISAKWGVV